MNTYPNQNNYESLYFIYYLDAFVYKFFVFPFSVVIIAANITPIKNTNTIAIPTISDIPLCR